MSPSSVQFINLPNFQPMKSTRVLDKKNYSLPVVFDKNTGVGFETFV